MRLIKPSAEIIEQKPGLNGLLQHIERCGRTCYKSEDKITNDSAPKFVDMLVKRGHTAMVEHGTVYLAVFDSLPGGFGGPASEEEANTIDFYHNNKYSEVVEHYIGCGAYEYLITTNYRVLLQNDRLDDLEYQCEPSEHHVKRVTVKFVCDRGVSHEYVRHRVFSFAQESTRYCNYSKDKFNKEITFILPPWVNERQLGEHNSEELLIQMGNLNSPAYTQEDLRELYFLFGLASSEIQYFNLLKEGWIAQQARAVLSNSLKTELIMTGTIEQWKGFFKLRDANDAHPQARELAQPLHQEFISRGLL